jgi:hypothetical protein
MTVWIIEYETEDGPQLRRFNTIELLWNWLQVFCCGHGGYPKNMLVFQAECVFDGN